MMYSGGFGRLEQRFEDFVLGKVIGQSQGDFLFLILDEAAQRTHEDDRSRVSQYTTPERRVIPWHESRPGTR